MQQVITFGGATVMRPEQPTAVVTIATELNSCRVIEALRGLASPNDPGPSLWVFQDLNALQEQIAHGAIVPEKTVALGDVLALNSGLYSFVGSKRAGNGVVNWATGSGLRWGVLIRKSVPDGRFATIAHQLWATFIKKFATNVNAGKMPWGIGAKGKSVPETVRFGSSFPDLLEKLNQGPDLAHGIANSAHHYKIPQYWRISWKHVAPGHATLADPAALVRATNALVAFQGACVHLLNTDRGDAARELLSRGVDIQDPGLLREYLQPKNPFSIDRPDIHFTPEGLRASEIDEMPGGLAEAVFLDYVYDVNQGLWREAFGRLFAEGPVLFGVSQDWSRVYQEEVEWLVGYLRSLGYQADVALLGDCQDLDLRKSGVWYQGTRFATVVRLFPVFEASNCQDMRHIAWQAGLGNVRLWPEFASNGNKAWFCLYWLNRDFFHEVVGVDTARELDRLIPQTKMPTQEELWTDRAWIQKVFGANPMATRGHGVYMPRGEHSDSELAKWLETVNGHPVLLQDPFAYQPTEVCVYDGMLGAGKVFPVKGMIRPWSIGGRLVSAMFVGVPATEQKVHGMTEMTVAPVQIPT